MSASVPSTDAAFNLVPATPTAMNVVFVIHQIGSRADGGIQSISEIIANTPALRKHVITNLQSDASNRWRAYADVSFWSMSEAQYTQSRSQIFYRLSQIYHRLLNNLRMLVLVLSSGARVVHINDHRAFWNTALGAKLAGACVIFNVRDTLREGARSLPLWRACLAICDCFLVLSREMVEYYRKALLPTSGMPRNAGKFAHLYSIVDRSVCFPVDGTVRAALRSDLAMDPTRPAVVYVGRFDTKKAQLEFICSALPALRSQRPDIIVYMVGDFDPARDAYAAECARQADVQGASDNVRFVGYSLRIADWYRACDAVVLASRREGLPRCVIEAIACGAPVVSFAVCSVTEILKEHDCGVVVPAGDYASMSREVAALLADDNRRALYRARGPVVAARLFDATGNAERYLHLVRAMESGHA